MTKSAFWISCLLSLLALSAIAAGPPNIDKALEAQHGLVSERPYDASVHNDLGNLLALVERWDDASAAYQRAIELDPADASARFNLALLDEQQGRLEEAEDGLLLVVEAVPQHGRAYYQLGTIYATKGERNKAMEAYARSFAADPTLTFASNNPHIIENEYRMEALLMAKRYEVSTETQQPRVYGDPDRIRALMILEEERAAAEEAAKHAEQSEPREEMLEDDDDDMSSSFDGRMEDDDDDNSVRGETTSNRVLSQESIREEGRGATPTRTRRRPSGVGSGSSYRPPSSSGGSRQQGGVTRVEGSARRAGSDSPSRSEGSLDGDSGDDESQTRRPSTRPRRVGRAGYRAGTASTGRLDLDLLPVQAPGAEPVNVRAAKR